MFKRFGVVVLLIVLSLMVMSPAVAQVQTTDITVSNSTAKIGFPLSLNLSCQMKSNVDITDIRVRYKVEQISFADVTSEAFVDFTPGRTVDAKWTLDLRKIGGLPPGTNLEFWWDVANAAGKKLETKAESLQFNDSRYPWRSIKEGNITLYWYDGDDSFAKALMGAAQQSLVRLARDTRATLVKPIKLYIYSSSRDLQGAMVFPQEWTGGVAYTEFGVIAIGISPGNLGWGQRTVTHELAHQVLFQMTDNPYNEIPIWLNEGYAVYAEGVLDPQFAGPLKQALARNTVFSVRTLCSPFSALTDKSLLSYAQSFSLVEYLLRQYGGDKYLELMNTFKKGSDYDEAFKKVYGFDMDGLDALWKPYAQAQYK